MMHASLWFSVVASALELFALAPDADAAALRARQEIEPCTSGYDPCIPPGPDVDCAGGRGDGPRYVEGPVYVTGSDPYGLDRDGDGVGCE